MNINIYKVLYIGITLVYFARRAIPHEVVVLHKMPVLFLLKVLRFDYNT